MPLTKTTTRLPPAICPSCKETIERQNFRYHVLMCVGKQHWCNVCRKTFKKKAYLLQHLRRVHGEETLSLIQTTGGAKSCEQVRRSPSPPAESKRTTSDCDSEPEIEVGKESGEESTTAEEEGRNNRCDDAGKGDLRAPGTGEDTYQPEVLRAAEDLDMGRVVRKRTTPLPLPTGKTRKLSQKKHPLNTLLSMYQ